MVLVVVAVVTTWSLVEDSLVEELPPSSSASSPNDVGEEKFGAPPGDMNQLLRGELFFVFAGVDAQGVEVVDTTSFPNKYCAIRER